MKIIIGLIVLINLFNAIYCSEKQKMPLNNGLTSAARKGDLQTMSLLIKKGARIDATDNEGLTALIAAGINNQVEAVKELLKQGAQVNQIGLYGKTALDWMLVPGNAKAEDIDIDEQAFPDDKKAIINLLREHGALTTKQLEEGNIALT